MDMKDVVKKVSESFQQVHADMQNLKNEIVRIKKDFNGISQELDLVKSSLEKLMTALDVPPIPPKQMLMSGQSAKKIKEDVESGDLFYQSRGIQKPKESTEEESLFDGFDDIDSDDDQDEEDFVEEEQVQVKRIPTRKKTDVSKIVSRFKKKKE